MELNNKQVAQQKKMSKQIEKRTFNSQQTTGNGRIPKDPDVPRKGTNPKDDQDKLPPKKR